MAKKVRAPIVKQIKGKPMLLNRALNFDIEPDGTLDVSLLGTSKYCWLLNHILWKALEFEEKCITYAAGYSEL